LISPLLKLVGQRLDKVRTGQRIDNTGDIAFMKKNLLNAERLLFGKGAGNRMSLVQAVNGKGICPPQYGGYIPLV
jgi:hypothetical protein